MQIMIISHLNENPRNFSYDKYFIRKSCNFIFHLKSKCSDTEKKKGKIYCRISDAYEVHIMPYCL